MTTNQELKHAAEMFDQMTDEYIQHDGVPGQSWYQHKYGKWQSQAVYAQGRPNPDAKVRGNKVDSDTKKRMSTMNDLAFILSDRSSIPVYPKQKLSDLKRLNKPVDKSVRYEINHPSFEKDADGYSNYDGRHCNCPNCAMAFEMTERGYDVIARPAEDGSNVGDIERFFQNKQLQSTGATSGDLKKASKLYEEYSNADEKYFDAYHAWKNGNIFSRPRLEKEKDAARRERDKSYDKYFDEADSIVNKVADNTNKAILSQGPSARGIIVVGWADSDDITGPFRTTAYHAFNYKNKNGKVKFYDVQSGRGNNLTGFTIDEAKDGFFQDVDPRDVFIMRTDNAKVSERTMDAVYSPNRSKELKHVANVFDQMTDTYLIHYGVPVMEWYKNKAERYQPQAQYARFIPNPNAKVRGQKEKSEKKVSNPKKQNGGIELSKLDKYPLQTLNDLKHSSTAPTYESRVALNAPKQENVASRLGRTIISGNCSCCAMAFEMHERGYDVFARTRIKGVASYDMAKAFTVNGAFKDVRYPPYKVRDRLKEPLMKKDIPGYLKTLRKEQDKTYQKMISQIKKQGDNSRGLVTANYASGFPGVSFGGHVFNYKNENGTVKFYDVQAGKLCPSMIKGLNEAKAANYFRQFSPESVMLFRTDNLEPNDRVMNFIYSPDSSEKIKHSGEFIQNEYLSHSGQAINASDAFDRVCAYLSCKPNVVVCKEYEEFFMFFLTESNDDQDDKLNVGWPLLVKKSDGKVSVYDPADDPVYDKDWKPVTFDKLKHAAEMFDQMTDEYIQHDGVPGQSWYQHKYGKWQSQAVYAQGRPNPDAKVRGQKETDQSNSKKVILDRDSFNALPNKKRIKMHTDAGLGKNKAFNKMMTDSLKQEKDGTHGIINTYGPRIKSAMMKYEVHNGKITYREALFGRKVSKKFADNILNQSIWGNYTRDTTPLKKGLFHAADICNELSELYLQHSDQYVVDKADSETDAIKHAADVFDHLTDKFLISMQTAR